MGEPVKQNRVYPIDRFREPDALSKDTGADTHDNDVLGVVGESPPLLDCSEALCFCFKFDHAHFRPYDQKKYVFYFRVIEPAKHEGVVLKMYVRDGEWKNPPVSSKLWQIARVANPDLKPGSRITASLFLKKLFRCRLGPTKGPVPYTVIQMLLEKVAG